MTFPKTFVPGFHERSSSLTVTSFYLHLDSYRLFVIRYGLTFEGLALK